MQKLRVAAAVAFVADMKSGDIKRAQGIIGFVASFLINFAL